MKRSSCASGSGYVPSCSIGFCVARTKNGKSSGNVLPPAVTLYSCMDCKSAAWVLGGMRLISRSSISARVLIKSVFARPGTPTSKQWPRANSAINTSSITWSWPTMTLRISLSMWSRLLANSSISAISCCSISVDSMGVLFNRLITRAHQLVESRPGDAGFFRIAERRVGVAEQTVDERVERVDLDRFLQRAPRFLVILHRVLDAAQLHVGVGVVRLHVEGFL